MTLSRRQVNAPRPARGPARSAGIGILRAGHELIGVFQEMRREGWSALVDLVEGWSSGRSTARRRANARRYLPGLGSGGLETRALLTYWHVIPRVLENATFLLHHPGARTAFLKNFPPQVQHAPLNRPVSGITRRRFVIATQTAYGGQAVEVTALDGTHYMLKLSYTSNTLATDIAEGLNGQNGASTSVTAAASVSMQNQSYPQPVGVVRAYAMPGGRVGIIVDGSTPNTDLTINPIAQPQYKGFAKSFAYGEAGRNHVLNIGQITVTSGQIGAIEGYQTAILSGPLTAMGNTPIDRIALDALVPGASITTGGDLNTLDVLHGITLSGSGSDISIGRDLNLLNVGNGITLSNGANILIHRNLGLLSQPPKGTGTGSNVLSLNYANVSNAITSVTIPSVGSFVQGNVNISPGSFFGMAGLIYNTMYVEGSVNGYSRLFEQYGSPAQANPPFLTQLPTYIFSTTTTTNTGPPATPAGPAPNGYLTALQGVTP